jgi:alpha-methylacyl-CoA racemase
VFATAGFVSDPDEPLLTGSLSARPLRGITVVDLTRLLPGPYCTQLLAQLGADVLKIEDPGAGDPTRSMPPLHAGVGVYFKLLNRGKRSVALDLRHSSAREALDTMLARADVCVEGFRPETSRRIGVDGASLAARHHHLLHCSITGYGVTGARADRAGHDLNYQAAAGLLALTEAPRVPRLLIADITAGLHAAIAILARLAGRERTGRGHTVDVSLYAAALSWLPFADPSSFAESADGRLDLTGEHACYNIYEAADGEWLALAALEGKFWHRFCERVDRLDWVAQHFAEEPRRSELVGEVRALFRTRSREHWLRTFESVDCCLSSIVRPSDAARSVPHLLEGRVPELGEDTVRVLSEAGISAGTIHNLRALGAIR